MNEQRVRQLKELVRHKREFFAKFANECHACFPASDLSTMDMDNWHEIVTELDYEDFPVANPVIDFIQDGLVLGHRALGLQGHVDVLGLGDRVRLVPVIFVLEIFADDSGQEIEFVLQGIYRNTHDAAGEMAKIFYTRKAVEHFNGPI